MRIIFDQEELLYGVSLAQRVVPNRYPMPIVTGLFLKTMDEETVEFIGNDMEISLQVSVKARVEEPGEAVLPARFLADFVRRLPPGEVTLSMPPGEFTARLECQKLSIELRSMNPLDYPAPPKLQPESEDEFWRAPQKTLKQAIKSVDFAISQDESRPAMTGMLLLLSNEGSRVVAMDGFRFAEKQLALISPVERECIVPGKAIVDLTRLLADDDEPFACHIGTNHLTIRFSRLIFQSRLIEAPFPFKTANDLIRKDPSLRVLISRKALISCVERALLVTRDDTKGSNIIRFNFEDGLLTINSNAPDLGRITEELEVEMSGENLLIGFNGRFLLDILNAIEDDKVSFLLTGALTAGIIRGEKTADFTSILSPIRLATVT
ncbi:MAG: DNA polymerase III subunit beta [Symbiobacteriaceae bacterium]|nr:DNA polymerase III subunit beta [Symbiobacteriaceae bacterium]